MRGKRKVGQGQRKRERESDMGVMWSACPVLKASHCRTESLRREIHWDLLCNCELLQQWIVGIVNCWNCTPVNCYKPVIFLAMRRFYLLSWDRYTGVYYTRRLSNLKRETMHKYQPGYTWPWSYRRQTQRSENEAKSANEKEKKNKIQDVSHL